MASGSRLKAPTSFWIVAVLSLFWNATGANDFLQTQLENRSYIESMTQGLGLTVDQLIEYYRSFPWWANAAWALGVWGSFLGSILLFWRSRFALHAFLASLAGLIVTSVFNFAYPMPGQTTLIVPIVLTIVVFGVLLGLIWYTRRMIARRVLA